MSPAMPGGSRSSTQWGYACPRYGRFRSGSVDRRYRPALSDEVAAFETPKIGLEDPWFRVAEEVRRADSGITATRGSRLAHADNASTTRSPPVQLRAEL